MGNCFPKLRGKKKKSVSEILSVSSCSPSCCSRTSSKLEDDMVKELSSSALESESSSSLEAELDQISETIQFTEGEKHYHSIRFSSLKVSNITIVYNSVH